MLSGESHVILQWISETANYYFVKHEECNFLCHPFVLGSRSNGKQAPSPENTNIAVQLTLHSRITAGIVPGVGQRAGMMTSAGENSMWTEFIFKVRLEEKQVGSNVFVVQNI